jgi:RNA polymerase sigma-70 factor, ECF subfamily
MTPCRDGRPAIIEHVVNERTSERVPEDPSERFYRLVWPQRAAVYRVARILLGEGPAADDLFQDAMLKAYRAIGSFREGTDVRAWLRTIVRNARVDRLRAERPHQLLSLDDAAAAEVCGLADAREASEAAAQWEDPEALLAAFSDQQVIDALQQLPEEIRWTLLLVDVEQVDHADAAALLGVPVGTIKSRTSRGRAMLRLALLPVARDRRLIR